MILQQEYGDGIKPVKIEEYPTGGHIYAILYDDEIVKIGRTKNPKDRLFALCNHRMEFHRIEKCYFSVSVNYPVFCEHNIKKQLCRNYDLCYGRECFDMPFDDAVNSIRQMIPDCWFYGDCFESIKKKFPNIPHQARQPEDEILRNLFALFQFAQENKKTIWRRRT